MHWFTSLVKLSIIIAIVFQLCFISEANAGVKENIGGGSNPGTGTSSGSKNSAKTVMYVLAATAVAFVAWKYFSEKEEKNDKDSLKAAVLKPLYDFNNSLAWEARIVEQKLPVNINLDFDSSIYNDRRFLLAVRLRL